VVHSRILRDMARVLMDDRGRGLLVGAHHRAQVFRVELARELGGAHQVAEEHRELSSFRLGGPLRGASDFNDVCRDGGLRSAGTRSLRFRPWRRPQRRSAAVAELASGLDTRATARADATEQCAAFATESRALAIVCVAAGTPHCVAWTLAFALAKNFVMLVGQAKRAPDLPDLDGLRLCESGRPREGGGGRGADQGTPTRDPRLWGHVAGRRNPPPVQEFIKVLHRHTRWPTAQMEHGRLRHGVERGAAAARDGARGFSSCGDTTRG
jgi:hypothetical protein